LEDRLTPSTLDFLVNTTSPTSGSPTATTGGIVDAVNAANADTTDSAVSITFDASVFTSGHTTISLTGGLTLNPHGNILSITIDATSVGGVTIDGNASASVLGIQSGTVSLTDLTISGGNASTGGGITNSGTLSLTNCTVSGNSANTGGGIYNQGTLTLSNDTLSGNTGVNGGAIEVLSGTATISDCNISGNSGSTGAGIFNYQGTLSLSNSTLAGNTASSLGGGIYNQGMLRLTNSTVSNNEALQTAGGGGGGIANSGTLSLSNGTVTGNSAKSSAGGILNSGTLTLSNSTVSGNSAGISGGGILNAGTLTLSNSAVSGNSARLGGGIDNKNNTASISNSTISNNTAGQFGGGIYNRNAVCLLTDSTLGSNSASTGGGILNNGTLSLSNSTVSSNSAGSSGGGILNTGTLTLTNSTVSGNSATRQGGGIEVADSLGAILVNTIVAGNSTGTGSNDLLDYSLGTFDLADSYNNLIGDANSAAGFTNGTKGNIVGNNGSGIIPIATILNTTLAANGSTGPETLALVTGSLALGAGEAVGTNVPQTGTVVGTVPATDERGVARAATPDIGAYEFVPTISSVVGPTAGDYDTGANLDFTVTYNESVTVDTSGGTPYLSLAIGSSTVHATYLSGSGTTSLTFQYTVQAGAAGALGHVSVASPMVLNGGTIEQGGDNATLTFTTPDTSGVSVNASPPTISTVTGPSAGDYDTGANLDFTVTYDTAVTVDTTGGTPYLSLTIGSHTVHAAYLSGSGTADLDFRYTVQAGDASGLGNVSVASPIVLNGGTIQSSLGTNAALTFTPPTTSGVSVNAPTVTSNTANLAQNATSFTITGTNFSTTAANDSVALNLGAAGTVASATGTSLTVTFTTQPTSTGALTAIVTTDGVTSGAAVQVATVVPASSNMNAIAGTVFLDQNANGMQDPGESGLAGVTVFLDLNHNGILDTGEPTAVTDSNGNYLFANLPDGTFVVREANLTNQVPTFLTNQGYTDFHGTILTGPHAGSYSVTLSAGNVASGLNFGDVPITEVTLPTVRPDLYATNSPNMVTAYVQGLYHSILNRDTDPSGLAHWVGVLGASPTFNARLQVTQAIWNSPEHRGLEVDNYYETFLGRNADPNGRAYWVQQLEAGATEEQVALGFIQSAEYNADHSSTDSFIDALYTEILGRDADGAGVAAWSAELNANVSRATAASAILESTESSTRAIDSYYLAYLHRRSDSTGAASWLQALQTNEQTMGSEATRFLASDEYFANAIVT